VTGDTDAMVNVARVGRGSASPESADARGESGIHEFPVNRASRSASLAA